MGDGLGSAVDLRTGQLDLSKAIEWRLARAEEKASGSNGARNGGKSVPIAESRARKEAALAEKHELEVAQRRGELVPAESVAAQVREELSPVDLGLRTAHMRFAGEWSRKLGCSEGEAVHLIRDLADDLRAHIADAMEGEMELPPEFPHRALLVEAGVRTFADLAGVSDLTEIRGIGTKRAKEIREAMV